MPLVTTDDVVARLGRPTTDATEAARITAFIEDAEGLVTDYCRNDFRQHTDETFDLTVVGGRARLAPSLSPNLVISSITLHEETGDLVLTADEWKVVGSTLYVPSSSCSRASVTASWGWAAVPAAVKAAICSEVIRWLSVSPGTVMERTGDLEVQYAATAYSQGLSEAAKSMLSRYRRRIASISLHRPD
ncbi:hypothetical protein HKX69_05820 [Streptomyces argyrophyllae]|uniref:Phage gp6-like head-tail connector protein n=1 Tax=Streptomyces argyrophylli TaxID=2726118 RepID=A0A6M4PDE6_9ACTN|nr:hypothetical protein [Streptomyces argyrophyllae]QJS09095.1 hypothetical protein HKX69_05820 [Streptomyces argyrophyllae]